MDSNVQFSMFFIPGVHSSVMWMDPTKTVSSKLNISWFYFKMHSTYLNIELGTQSALTKKFNF